MPYDIKSSMFIAGDNSTLACTLNISSAIVGIISALGKRRISYRKYRIDVKIQTHTELYGANYYQIMSYPGYGNKKISSTVQM